MSRCRHRALCLCAVCDAWNFHYKFGYLTEATHVHRYTSDISSLVKVSKFSKLVSNDGNPAFLGRKQKMHRWFSRKSPARVAEFHIVPPNNPDCDIHFAAFAVVPCAGEVKNERNSHCANSPLPVHEVAELEGNSGRI